MLRDEAMKRAIAGDAMIAGLLAIIAELEKEIAQHEENQRAREDRQQRQDVWGCEQFKRLDLYLLDVDRSVH